MALISQLYGMHINEAIQLSEAETSLLLDHAQLALISTAMTNPQVRGVVQEQLQPVLREARATREQQNPAGAPPSPYS